MAGMAAVERTLAALGGWWPGVVMRSVTPLLVVEDSYLTDVRYTTLHMSDNVSKSRDGLRKTRPRWPRLRCLLQVGGELLEVLVERRDHPGEEWEERTADALDDLHSRAVGMGCLEQSRRDQEFLAVTMTVEPRLLPVDLEHSRAISNQRFTICLSRAEQAQVGIAGFGDRLGGDHPAAQV